MQNCISEVTLWIDWNKPKLYDDKTESNLIESDRIMLPDSAPTSIRVGSSDVPFVTHARNLGITISSNTTMDKHVTNICRSAYAELRRISSIRHLLAVSATKTLLSAFVLSKLDYCNSLLCGSPQFILDKLQRVQNSASRLVMKSRTGYQSAQGLTTRFHPCASTLSPTLLLSILLSVYPSTTLPDTSVHPRTHAPSVFLSSKLSHLVKSAFSFTGPTQWNLLPFGLRHS